MHARRSHVLHRKPPTIKLLIARSHMRIVIALYPSHSVSTCITTHPFSESPWHSISPRNCQKHFKFASHIFKVWSFIPTQPFSPRLPQTVSFPCTTLLVISTLFISFISRSPAYSPLRRSEALFHPNRCILLSVLCVWCFPSPEVHLNWCDGVCLCAVDIIPRRVNKGYAPSTRRPRDNKGLRCSALAQRTCAGVCLFNESSCYQIRMNKKWQTPRLRLCVLQWKSAESKRNVRTNKQLSDGVCACTSSWCVNKHCVWMFIYIITVPISMWILLCAVNEPSYSDSVSMSHGFSCKIDPSLDDFLNE